MKMYREVDVGIQIFITSMLGGDEWSASRLFRFTPWERAPGTHWKGGCMGPRAGLDIMQKRKIFHLSGMEVRSSSL
jgi:hypothetical protein